MTTFLGTEEEAKGFAILTVKNLNAKVFEQKPKKRTINQFGFEMEGNGYPFKSEGKELEVVISKTPRGWNVWIESNGLCMRL